MVNFYGICAENTTAMGKKLIGRNIECKALTDYLNSICVLGARIAVIEQQLAGLRK